MILLMILQSNFKISYFEYILIKKVDNLILQLKNISLLIINSINLLIICQLVLKYCPSHSLFILNKIINILENIRINIKFSIKK